MKALRKGLPIGWQGVRYPGGDPENGPAYPSDGPVSSSSASNANGSTMQMLKVRFAEPAASQSPGNPMPHIVQLDPKKVLRQFGPRPELGKAMPCLPKMRVESGFRWANSFGKLKPARHIIDVPRRVALQPAGRNQWRVICDECEWPAVLSWLRANCT